MLCKRMHCGMLQAWNGSRSSMYTLRVNTWIHDLTSTALLTKCVYKGLVSTGCM